MRPVTNTSDVGPRYVAGLFLADDYVIAGVAKIDEKKRPLFKSMKQDRHKLTSAKKDITDDLKHAFRLITSLASDGGVVSMAISLPGPVQGSGVASSGDSKISTSTFHPWGKNWQEADLKELVNNAIIAAKADNVLKNPPFRILPGAAAYALGDYYLDLLKLKSDDAVMKYCGETVLAHITIDDGITGAIVSNGKLMASRMHTELGHLPVRRHELDTFKPTCSAHAFPGCAESYVSLPALKRRWGENVEQAIMTWGHDNQNLQMVAFYLAQVCTMLVLFTAPSHISMSGRVVRSQSATGSSPLIDLVDQYTRVMLRVPQREALYPGYPEQSKPHFVRRRQKRDAGIYGCIQNAWDLAPKEMPYIGPK